MVTQQMADVTHEILFRWMPIRGAATILWIHRPFSAPSRSWLLTGKAPHDIPGSAGRCGVVPRHPMNRHKRPKTSTTWPPLTYLDTLMPQLTAMMPRDDPDHIRSMKAQRASTQKGCVGSMSRCGRRRWRSFDAAQRRLVLSASRGFRQIPISNAAWNTSSRRTARGGSSSASRRRI